MTPATHLHPLPTHLLELRPDLVVHPRLGVHRVHPHATRQVPGFGHRKRGAATLARRAAQSLARAPGGERSVGGPRGRQSRRHGWRSWAAAGSAAPGQQHLNAPWDCKGKGELEGAEVQRPPARRDKRQPGLGTIAARAVGGWCAWNRGRRVRACSCWPGARLPCQAPPATWPPAARSSRPALAPPRPTPPPSAGAPARLCCCTSRCGSHRAWSCPSRGRRGSSRTSPATSCTPHHKTGGGGAGGAGGGRGA